MAWSVEYLTTVMDKVYWILSTIWTPIILGVFGFSLLALFLQFRK